MKNILLKIIYYSGIWILFRYFYKNKSIILMYHGIVYKDIGVWTQVPVKQFDLQMSYLKKKYQIISSYQLVSKLKQKK